MLFGSILERGSTWRVSELLSVAEICDDIGDMLRLPAPPTPGPPTPGTADDDADCPVASTSAPAEPLPPPPFRLTSADMLIPFSPKLLLAASSRFRSLNDLFATISAISGLDVRHSIGSRSMCFLARGIGCRGSVVLPASSPELSVPVPPGPPSLPCLISSSMIFSSASCFCFFSCSFCWIFTREPTLLPSFSLEPPHTTPNASTDTATSLTSGASATTTTTTIHTVLVPGQAAASIRGAVTSALLRHASTRLVPEPAHVEVPVVHDHKEQAGGKAAQHGQRHEIPTVRPVWPHADHPQADEQTVFRKHYHVEGELQWFEGGGMELELQEIGSFATDGFFLTIFCRCLTSCRLMYAKMYTNAIKPPSVVFLSREMRSP
uniref:Uncharacterized protein n=1 Tax=Anopheles coluzzii TaxID=1518534 RepID=A0A8W7Q2I0_ANOCL